MTESNAATFWVVYCGGAAWRPNPKLRTPVLRHSTYAEACVEADLLAREYAGTPFVVCQAKTIFVLGVMERRELG